MATGTGDAGIILRSAADEAADVQQFQQHYDNEMWKLWPNEGAFDGLEEKYDPISLKVKGCIPSWAAGTFFRTGPGKSMLENTSRGTHYVSHWFDGFAQTHRFDILPPDDNSSGCSIIYSSRGQSSAYMAAVKKQGWQTNISFGQRSDPCVGIFAKLMSVFIPRQFNHNVAVIPNIPGLEDNNKATQQSGHRTELDNVYLSTDASGLSKMDPKTLEPLGSTSQKKLHPSLKGPLSCAHAQRDLITGDLFNYNLDFGKTATYRIFRVNAKSGTTDILATISEPEIPAAYIHSFFLTENYVVLCVQSSHFGWNGLKILWERNLLNAIKPFNKDARCKWLVVDRRQGRGVVARFSTPASFFFHSVNAFEQKSKNEKGEEVTDICLDYAEYENMDVIHVLYYDILMNRDEKAVKAVDGKHKTAQSQLVRYKFTIPALSQTRKGDYSLTAEKVFSIPSPHSGELPIINPSRAGQPYRYVYGTCNRGMGFWMDAIVKTDVKTRDALIWSGGIGHTPGEPIFVPRPGGTEEDDGVILTIVLDGSAQKSYLLCLDAKTLQELGRAEADFPIPLGLHGVHAPLSEKPML